MTMKNNGYYGNGREGCNGGNGCDWREGRNGGNGCDWCEGRNGGNGCESREGRNSGNGYGTMRALLPCIIDSCQRCEQLTQSFELLALPAVAGTSPNCDTDLQVGTVLPIKQCGDLTVDVISNEEDGDDIATTVLLSVPVAFMECSGCAQVPYYRVAVTDVKTFALEGSDFSSFELLGSDVQSLTAVVTAIDEASGIIRATVSMIVRVYVAQTVAREVILPIYGDVNVSRCNNGCLNNLQIAANNVTRVGFNTES